MILGGLRGEGRRHPLGKVSKRDGCASSLPLELRPVQGVFHESPVVPGNTPRKAHVADSAYIVWSVAIKHDQASLLG